MLTQPYSWQFIRPLPWTREDTDMDDGQPGTPNTPRGTVSVIGRGDLSADSPLVPLCEALGRLICDRGYVLVSGGRGGVMAAACRGARSSSSWWHGATVGILPGHDPADANPWVDVALPTGLDVGRNAVVAHSDCVIAIGGGAGTLSEIALAWQLLRPVIAFRVDGWSGRLAGTRLDDRVRQPHLEDDQIYGVDTPEEALDLVEELRRSYTHRHPGIGR